MLHTEERKLGARMMRRIRDINLSLYSISKIRARELRYFCLGYEERRRAVENVYNRSPSPADGMPRSGKLSKPVEEAAIVAANLSADNDLIDRTLDELFGTSEPLRRLFFEVVTKGKTYDDHVRECDLNGARPLVSRGKFIELRHKFFYELDNQKKRG